MFSSAEPELDVMRPLMLTKLPSQCLALEIELCCVVLAVWQYHSIGSMFAKLLEILAYWYIQMAHLMYISKWLIGHVLLFPKPPQTRINVEKRQSCVNCYGCRTAKASALQRWTRRFRSYLHVGNVGMLVSSSRNLANWLELSYWFRWAI